MLTLKFNDTELNNLVLAYHDNKPLVISENVLSEEPLWLQNNLKSVISYNLDPVRFDMGIDKLDLMHGAVHNGLYTLINDENEVVYEGLSFDTIMDIKDGLELDLKGLLRKRVNLETQLAEVNNSINKALDESIEKMNSTKDTLVEFINSWEERIEQIKDNEIELESDDLVNLSNVLAAFDNLMSVLNSN